jgi:hypothetical protein
MSGYAGSLGGGTGYGCRHDLIARRQIYRSIRLEHRIYRSTCSYLLVFLGRRSRDRRIFIERPTFLLVGTVASNDRRVAITILAMNISVSGDPASFAALWIGEVSGSGPVATLPESRVGLHRRRNKDRRRKVCLPFFRYDLGRRLGLDVIGILGQDSADTRLPADEHRLRLAAADDLLRR